MIGAAAFGMLTAVALEPDRSQGRLETEIVWQDRLMSNVGRLAVNGDGGMILASCYTLGIQRYRLARTQRRILPPRAERSRMRSPTFPAGPSRPRRSRVSWP